MNYFKSILQFFLIFIFSIHNIGAQKLEWVKEIILNSGRQGSNIRPRILTLDDHRGIIVWNDENDLSINYLTWEDDQFAPVKKVNMKGQKAFTASWASTEIAGRNNVVYIIFKSEPAETGAMFLLRSDNYGKDFSDLTLIPEQSGHLSRFPGVALDDAKEALISYMQFKDDWTEPGYVFLKTKSAGKEFDSISIVTRYSEGEACDCCPVSIESDLNRVAVLYRNNRNNFRNMAASISLNGGIDFSQFIELDTADWYLLSCPATGGDQYFEGDLLHTVWISGRLNGSHVYYSRLDMKDNKINTFFGISNKISRGLQQYFPRISGNKDTLGIVWNETGNNMDIYFTWMYGNKLSMLETEVLRVNEINSGVQATADIAFSGGNFHICWTDQSDNTIKYRRAKISNVLNSSKENNRKVYHYNFDMRNLNLNFFSSCEKIQIYDIMGNKIFGSGSSDNFSIPKPVSGIYFVSFESGQQTGMFKIFVP